MWFKAISRLKVNMDKSEVIPVGGLQQWRMLLRCWVIELGSSHLLIGSSFGCLF